MGTWPLKIVGGGSDNPLLSTVEHNMSQVIPLAFDFCQASDFCQRLSSYYDSTHGFINNLKALPVYAQPVRH